MDLLVRHKAANENVDQTVEAETQDHMDHTYGSCACAARALLTYACIPMYAFPQRKLQVATREPSSDCFWLPQRVTPPLFLKPTSVCNIDELEPSPLLCLCKQLYGDHVECACARSAV